MEQQTVCVKTQSQKIYEQSQEIKKERQEMAQWSPERKTEWNFKRFFKDKFLIRAGYSYLNGKGGVKNWKELQPDDLNEHFTWVYKNENEKDFLKLFKEMKKYFEENSDEIFCDKNIYKKYLPQSTAKNMNNLCLDNCA